MSDTIDKLFETLGNLTEADIEEFRSKITHRITDREVRLEPNEPLAPVGVPFVDKNFNSRLIRVTDGVLTDRRDSVANVSFRSPSSSNQYGWNSDSTRFLGNDTFGNAWPFTWDGNFASMGEHLLISGDVTFHDTEPNIVFGRYGNRDIYSQDLSKPPNKTLVISPDKLIPGVSGYTGNIYFRNGILIFSCGGDMNDLNHYVVHFPLNGGNPTILDTLKLTQFNRGRGFHVHATQADLSGRFVMLGPSNLSGDTVPNYVWDVQEKTIVPIVVAPSGHVSYGHSLMINNDTYNTPWDAAQWLLRDLRKPNEAIKSLVNPVFLPKEIYLGEHTSWNDQTVDNLPPITVATYRYDGVGNLTPFRALDNEIFKIDPVTGVIIRYCHHKSNVVSDVTNRNYTFWYTPRCNVSRCGKYGLFNTNWNKTLGLDPRESDPNARNRTDLVVVNFE